MAKRVLSPGGVLPRLKRPTAHKGRLLCCRDVIAPPSCLTSLDLNGWSVLVEYVSGVTGGLVQYAVYDYCSETSFGGNCSWSFRAPDGHADFGLSGSTVINGASLTSYGVAWSCGGTPTSGTAQGSVGFPTGGGVTVEQFFCSLTPITISNGSTVRRITAIPP